MKKQNIKYQTHGIGYGSFKFTIENLTKVQIQPVNNSQFIHAQPLQTLNVYDTNLQGPGYFQPTGINSGINIIGKGNKQIQSTNRMTKKITQRMGSHRNKQHITQQQQQVNINKQQPITYITIPENVNQKQLVTYQQNQVLNNQSQYKRQKFEE